MYIPTNFNGVLFLLREPHRSENENDDSVNTWPKRLLNDEIIIGTKHDKGAATKYRNRFREMLQYAHLSPNDLVNCAFYNINPLGGGATVSDMYEDMNKGSIASEIITDVKPRYVFTCIDIYKELKREYFILSAVETAGIRYANKSLKSFKYKNINFFEIYHPSCRRSSRILLPLS